MTKDELRVWIKRHEGYKTKPYVCTAGKLTIGFGRNLEDNGISKEEADFMLKNDMQRTENDLKSFSWYIVSPEHVQNALFNMCFNLGLPRLLTFRKMIKAIIDKDYKLAAREALNSKWATQVGQRAKDVALVMSGEND